MISRAQIIAEARSWIGTPYHHQARLKGVGVDCIGLPICVARNCGLVLPDADITGYSRQPDGTLLARADEYLTRISGPLQPGDIVATIVRRQTQPTHFGIVVDYGGGGGGGKLSLVHALCNDAGRGAVVEHRIDAGQLRRIVAAWRFPGVED